MSHNPNVDMSTCMNVDVAKPVMAINSAVTPSFHGLSQPHYCEETRISTCLLAAARRAAYQPAPTEALPPRQGTQDRREIGFGIVQYHSQGSVRQPGNGLAADRGYRPFRVDLCGLQRHELAQVGDVSLGRVGHVCLAPRWGSRVTAGS